MPAVINKYTLDFKDAAISLDKAAEDFRAGKISLDSLQKVLADTRISYKKIEFYLAFHYADYVKEHINGAPLLHIEKAGTSPVVLTPEGLQMMDELIFSEEASDEKVQISALAKQLNSNYNLLFASLNSKNTGKGNIAAMRIQLVRIYSLGLTGFDTPGSLNAIPETIASLEGMKNYLEENYPVEKTKDILQLFKGALRYLEVNNTFETLDRLEILKKYIDPIYSKLGKIEVGAEPEFLRQTTAWNPSSTSIFDNNFLNPYFFTDLKEG